MNTTAYVDTEYAILFDGGDALGWCHLHEAYTTRRAGDIRRMWTARSAIVRITTSPRATILPGVNEAIICGHYMTIRQQLVNPAEPHSNEYCRAQPNAVKST
jgi:hypothetical protein